ncbi:ABC transporter domain-containing protein [Caenorhabditis elegans]|nr:ABC transporter domain-containing protein [Caenorhabditis elegans]CDG24140.1 ABC transporter domain-containing protein [Caenorhabditis elegans]|eukprot:NP_001293855.1 ABC Transporter family [Caenorhabditis elegans]
MIVCIPETVVDYRFSTVIDAIHLTHLDYPHLEFTKKLEKAKNKLEDGEVDFLVLFKTLIETGKKIEYKIISEQGVFDKHCIQCDVHRKKTWGNAVEAQVVVNRFLYWLVKSRGFNKRSPHWQLSNVYVKHSGNDPMFLKRQSDLFLLWILLLPICSRLIDLWNNDRSSGYYNMFLSLHARRFHYFIAKFVFWYGIALIISLIVFIVNVLVVPAVFCSTYLQFVVCYAACIISFAIFLATTFPGSPLFAKIVGFLSMVAGEFGFGTVYHGIGFFQLCVRHFGKSEFDGPWIDAVCTLCMTGNCVLLITVSIYFDTYFCLFTMEPLAFYFPLEKDYWMPEARSPQLDTFFVKQIILLKPGRSEITVKKAHDEILPAKTSTGSKYIPPTPIVKGVPLVVLYGICKRIENHWRVKQVSLTVHLGEVVTLYGHHGCGSGEILSIIAGQMKPEYGEVMMEQSQRPLMISKTTDVPNVNYLNVIQYLRLISKMRGVSASTSHIDEMLEELDLIKVKNRSLDLLSTTQKERLRIAAVFVGQPDLVLIDFPTMECLPEWKFMVFRFIEKRKEKRSIIVSSYDPEETEAISDKVVLMSEGYVVLNGSCEAFKHSINSVFEIRIWPNNRFTDEQIKGMMKTLTLGDNQMKNDARFFETPNGKIRVTLPILYRRSIPLILRELDAVHEKFRIEFYELGKPNIHDIYANACYEHQQLDPLSTFDQLRDHYTKQQPLNKKTYFFKNMIHIFKDGRFLIETAAVVGLFLILTVIILLSYHSVESDSHQTREISLTSYESPITIYCDECEKEVIEGVTFEKKSRVLQLENNQAVLYWKDTAKADKELITVSRGDALFTMIVQNFAVSQMISKITGKHPQIKLFLESENVRTATEISGFSTVFNDISSSKAAMILTESYSLMYITAVFQMFVYTFSVVLPLRLVSTNMGPQSMILPWPRYVYFGFIYVFQLVVFLVIAIILGFAVLSMGFFATNTTSCYLRFLSAWFLSYASTLPLIYFLVFNIQNTKSVIPIILAISSLSVTFPNLVASFSAENQVSLQSLIQFVSWSCMLNPPSSLQVLAAFLNAGESLEKNSGTITSLILFCGAQFWIIVIFVLVIFQPGFSYIQQYWFKSSTVLYSSFERGTTLKPGARIKNSYIFVTNPLGTMEDAQDKGASGNIPNRPAAGTEPVQKPTSDYIAGSSMSIDDMSYITNYEENLVEKMATMTSWNDKQEVPVDNSATFLMGDQTKLKSALLTTIAKINKNEHIAFVPIVENISTIYTPFELLENAAYCNGFEITDDHISYLLDAFDLKEHANTQIKLLPCIDRRILMLLAKLVIKPNIVIIDQLEMFLPHSKMMTVWSFCARLRKNGLGIIYTSHHSGFAEHTATCCAHMYKGQFVRNLLPTSIKAKCTVLEVVPKTASDPKVLLHMLQKEMEESVKLPSTSRNITLAMYKDGVETIEKILELLRMLSPQIKRYSLRSGNCDEFLASAFGK